MKNVRAIDPTNTPLPDTIISPITGDVLIKQFDEDMCAIDGEEQWADDVVMYKNTNTGETLYYAYEPAANVCQ